MRDHYLRAAKWLWLWLFSLPYLAYAQVPFTVRGTLTDNRQEALAGATVLVTGTTVGTATDADGKYELSGSLPERNYTLAFNYVGFSSQSRPLQVRAGGTTLTYDVVLTEDILSLNAVVVIGSTVSQEKKQLGNTITSI